MRTKQHPIRPATACGAQFTVNHVMKCHMGGFPTFVITKFEIIITAVLYRFYSLKSTTMARPAITHADDGADIRIYMLY